MTREEAVTGIKEHLAIKHAYSALEQEKRDIELALYHILIGNIGLAFEIIDADFEKMNNIISDNFPKLHLEKDVEDALIQSAASEIEDFLAWREAFRV